MFAALTFDRDPLQLVDLGSGVMHWLQTLGGFASLVLLIWVPVMFLQQKQAGVAASDDNLSRSTLFKILAVFGLAAYLGLFVIYQWRTGAFGLPATTAHLNRLISDQAMQLALAAAGACAIVAVLFPLLRDLTRMRLGRILALANLSVKEAIRRRVLWAFLVLLLIALFGSWFIPYKSEHQVRTYVQVVFFAMSFFLLLAAGLLAAFGIPDDLRHQTIHTVLTKPVERFEIFLGRFLGYMALMTGVLIVVGVSSLLYVLRGVDPDAAEESLKARIPVYGSLVFENTRDTKKGESVGREWDYRSYIFGPAANQPTQYAVWNFQDLPRDLTNRSKVRLEYTFDIYRTTKGEEGKAVTCSIYVASRHFDFHNPAQLEAYRKERQSGKAKANISEELAEKYGFYEVSGKEVVDYHTQHIDIPAGVVKNALQPSTTDAAATQPLLRIWVKCDSRTQFLGMAKYDLYLRQDDPESGGDAWRFSMNFFKGTFGLWLRLCLIVGIAVALSTYLSGVISWLTTMCLFTLGFLQEFIHDVAFGKTPGGGPAESMLRLLQQPGGKNPLIPMEGTAATRVASAYDLIFRLALRPILSIIPDVYQYDFTDFVAEGVAVPGSPMLVSLIYLVGYLLPWAVLAYFLLKWREIASSN